MRDQALEVTEMYAVLALAMSLAVQRYHDAPAKGRAGANPFSLAFTTTPRDRLGHTWYEQALASFEIQQFSDATRLKGDSPAILAHVLSDALTWGLGFTQAIELRWPAATQPLGQRLKSLSNTVRLGDVLWTSVAPNVEVAHLVCEKARDSSLDLASLTRCLAQVAERARASGAVVHAPPLGTGLSRAPWNRVREALEVNLIERGVSVVIHCLGSHPPQ